MNEIGKLKLHLKQAMEIAEANIEKAENIDLEDMAQTLESFIDELDNIGDFETYGELDEGFKRMQELAGVLKENKSPDLTDKEKIYLESKLEEFLNKSLFSSKIMDRDEGEFEPSLEEQAIQFIIKSLQDRISYYQ